MGPQTSRLALLLPLAALSCKDEPETPQVQCDLSYALPADIPVPLNEAEQATFDLFSWQSFLALNAQRVGAQVNPNGDNATQWSQWSSSVDLIRCNTEAGCECPGDDCKKSGSHHYPPECQAISNFSQYRVLDQLDKADDSFLEAMTSGLSNDPVIDAQGRFLRYEILLSPATYDKLAMQGLYDFTSLQRLACQGDKISFDCGNASYTGGDPSEPSMGGMVVKVAWMEDGLASQAYHRQELLVYTPGYRNPDGVATCERKSMAMVGMHIAHKTVRQPRWIWSTFEHARNTPDCAGLPPEGKQMPSVNTACPSEVDADYNFFRQDCSGGQCASCNATPASNEGSSDANNPASCRNPSSPTRSGWCVNSPPNDSAGYSTLCTQVPVEANYPDAFAQNNACVAALGADSVWSSYRLISTQWNTSDTDPTECQTVADVSRESQRPQVNVKADVPDGMGTMMVDTRPWLGNTSMESYERSNCNACHSKSQLKLTNVDDDTMLEASTDFIYFLGVEVCQQWCNQNGQSPCSCLTGTATVSCAAL